MTNPVKIAEYRSGNGRSTFITHRLNASFEELANAGQTDVAIVSTEDGFSPLGASRDFFERDLGVSYQDVIRPLADWNRSENVAVSLVSIKSRRVESALRGVILAPGNNTRSYSAFGNAYERRPSRDYYYNISYEAIAEACLRWGAKKISISHLCASGTFHADMATCHAEALMHFCMEHPNAQPDSLIFCGCCIDPIQLSGIDRLYGLNEPTKHRTIRVVRETRTPSVTVLNLNWRIYLVRTSETERIN